MNYIWGAFIILGILTGILTGRIDQVTEAAISGGKDAVLLSITMLGILSTWTGIMKIAQKGGAIELLSNKMRPLLTFLFPSVPINHKAMQYISTNMIANFLGLGWAATPAGLSAMKELNRLNPNKKEATHAMCMFLIINMSSIQLLPVTILAYRQQYASKSPAEIILPCMIATFFSTVAGILYGKWKGGKNH